MMHSGTLKRTILLLGIFGLSHSLSGCAATYNEMQAVVSKTGDHSGTANAEVVAPTPTHFAAVPSPREIFDFHPAGAKADTFREAFVIDPNDGPLSADVRRSAAELKAYNEHLAIGTDVAVKKRCGENDVAAAKPGCVAPTAKATTVTSAGATTLR